MDVPDTLAARIALFREQAAAFQDQDQFFRFDSWVQVMLGQGLEPRDYHHLARMLPAQDLQRALGGLDAGIRHRLQTVPRHADFLRRFT